nr:MAG TPA: hypothetical protein [Caudoviricetes sp.]
MNNFSLRLPRILFQFFVNHPLTLRLMFYKV